MRGITFFVTLIFSVVPCFQLLPMITKKVACKRRQKCNSKFAKVQRKIGKIKRLLMQMKADGKQLSEKERIDLELRIGSMLMDVLAFDRTSKKHYN